MKRTFATEPFSWTNIIVNENILSSRGNGTRIHLSDSHVGTLPYKLYHTDTRRRNRTRTSDLVPPL